MKRIIPIIALLFSLVIPVYAQRSNLIIGPAINLPSGSSANTSALGLGGFLKGELGLSPKFSLTGQGDLVSFLGKKFLGNRMKSVSYVPVKAGFKYYTDENFYLEGQLGASFPITGSGKASFAWSPGLGTYLKNRNNDNQLDIGVRYEAWTSTNMLSANGTKYTSFGFFGLRVGYAFNL